MQGAIANGNVVYMKMYTYSLSPFPVTRRAVALDHLEEAERGTELPSRLLQAPAWPASLLLQLPAGERARGAYASRILRHLQFTHVGGAGVLQAACRRTCLHPY